MRIIFVGIHNQNGLKPLDSSTPSGKKIDDVIALLGLECIKTNLYDCDYLPKDRNEKAKHLYEWGKKYNPSDDDIIVLLGKDVAMGFYKYMLGRKNVIQFYHPSPRNMATIGIDYVGTLSKMLHNVLSVQGSDTTEDHSSNADGVQKILSDFGKRISGEAKSKTPLTEEAFKEELEKQYPLQGMKPNRFRQQGANWSFAKYTQPLLSELAEAKKENERLKSQLDTVKKQWGIFDK